MAIISLSQRTADLVGRAKKWQEEKKNLTKIEKENEEMKAYLEYIESDFFLEKEAREIANENAGDENRGEFLREKTANTKTPWLDEKYSTCIEISGNGEKGLIMQDFARA